MRTARSTATSGSTAIGKRDVAQFGVFVYLASDLMLFAAFFAAYFLLRAENSPWPPAGTELDYVKPGLGAVLLVVSSFTLLAGERRAEGGDGTGFRWLLLATIALGAGFLVLQLWDYASIDFTVSSSVYGSAYWGLTGLHTVHVIAGLFALGLLYLRTMRAGPPSASRSWTRAIAPFWHLVDVVWIAVFITIWVLR